jgi:hypothetical protein
MKHVDLVQDSCSDILEDAKQINEARAKEEAKYIEDSARVKEEKTEAENR